MVIGREHPAARTPHHRAVPPHEQFERGLVGRVSEPLDQFRIQTTFGKTATGAGFLAYFDFDFDGDGDVDSADLFQFYRRFGSRL